MAPAEVTEDYYAVLEILPTATLDAITKSYRRLALDRHPDRNLNNVNSTAAFQLVRSSPPSPFAEISDKPTPPSHRPHPPEQKVCHPHINNRGPPCQLQNAYQTLSSPTERRTYDLSHPGIKARNESTHRCAAAAQAAQQRATANATKLRTLEAELKRHEDELFEKNRPLRKLEAEVKRSRELDAEDDKREKARNNWWTYLAAPIYGKTREETVQEKLLRDRERLQRTASRRIKESEVMKQEKEVEALLRRIGGVRSRIGEEKRRAHDEAAAVERARMARMQDEARKRQEQELRKTQEEMVRAEAMRKRREQEERERQQEAYQEHVRNLERDLRERREREEANRVREREESLRWAEAARQRAREPGTSAQRNSGRQKSQTNGMNVCGHQRFWNKVDGRHLCSECKNVQPKFAFRCPGCSKLACANCRQKLRGEGQRPFRGKSKGDHNVDFDPFDY